MTGPASMVGALAVLDSLKAERDKAIRQRDDARSERDDAHITALLHSEASAAAMKDLQAYKADRAELAAIVEDLEEQNASLRARLEELEPPW